MPKTFTLALLLAAITLIATDNPSLVAQTTAANPSPAITVSISLQKDKVPLGESPWVLFAVKNLTDHEIVIEDSMCRLHVEGEKGERPRTPASKVITNRFQSRVATLRPVVYVPWIIAPGETSIHKYKLAYLFDLSDPGQYTIYIEVMDPSSHKWLRTNTANFEMQRPTQ